MNDLAIFLVLAGLALLFRWLTSHVSNAREKTDLSEESAQPQRPPAQSEEERVRRFLEALGMPAGTQPPPLVRPRRVVTPAPRPASVKPKRNWAQPLPPLVTTPEEQPPFSTALPPQPVVEVQLETPPEIIIPPPLPRPVVARSSALPSSPVPRGSLGALLRSRESVRNAIVLREVLGPPRGLEAAGHFSGL
ncbi:MAG: hypothetical protein ABI540_01155 [Spartobacteria bacterium]